MARTVRLTAPMAPLALLAACAGGDGEAVDPSALNHGVSVTYGTVESVTPVPGRQMGQATGGVAGGLLGLALTGGHSTDSVLLGTAGGALAGSLLGHALQGSSTADRFVISRADGSRFEVTTEPRDIEVGDCVAIEEGEHTNLRRVAPALCRSGTALHADDTVTTEARRAATSSTPAATATPTRSTSPSSTIRRPTSSSASASIAS
jgi:outer membrane lipoprotein SlyB